MTIDMALDYLPRLPRRKDWRIGCIGAGFIMRDCHLVAYGQAGFNPVAITSRNPEHAQTVATQHHIAKVHHNIDELLADQSIEILDIAVPPDVQADVLRKAAEHGNHLRGILAQKPLALSVADARDVVERCRKAGIVLGVNQNMRYDQSVRAMKDILQRGWIGQPVLATIDMRAIPHWMPWAESLHSLSTFVMSIHHLDTFRYWLGTPDRVLASTRSDPRTRFPHADGINLYILEYDDGIRAASWDDVWTGPAREGSESDIGIRWRVEGTDGLRAAPSAGQAIRHGRRARLISRPSSILVGTSRAGKKCGSPTPSLAPWRSFCVRWRTVRNRKSAGGITSRRSRCAKRYWRRRRSIA